MQSKEDIEQWYQTKDPWNYEATEDDAYRKEQILGLLNKQYKRALDIGAGEGWVTKDLPADEIHAIEISDNAASRFPKNVVRVFEPKGKYDLVIATGVLYEQYDYKQILQWVKECSTDTFIACNIAEWEKGLKDLRDFRCVYETVFTYRQYREHLCLYKRT